MSEFDRILILSESSLNDASLVFKSIPWRELRADSTEIEWVSGASTEMKSKEFKKVWASSDRDGNFVDFSGFLSTVHAGLGDMGSAELSSLVRGISA